MEENQASPDLWLTLGKYVPAVVFVLLVLLIGRAVQRRRRRAKQLMPEQQDRVSTVRAEPGQNLLRQGMDMVAGRVRDGLRFFRALSVRRIYANLGRLAMAPDETGHQRAHEALRGQIARVEAELGDGPFFAGAPFSLVDATCAPFWMRLDLLEAVAPLGLLDAAPRCAAWSRALLALPEVSDSVVEDFPARYAGHIAATDGYGAACYAAGLMQDRVAS